MDKEKWIEATMLSLQQQQMAEANPFLYTRVMQKLSYEKGRMIPVKWMLAAGCLLLVLCFFNISIYTDANRQHAANNIDRLIKDYCLSGDEVYLSAK